MKHYEKKKSFVKLSPIAASLLLLIPVMAQAEIVIKNGSVTTAANGVPIVNIKEANSKGLSHNIYETLNVGEEGSSLTTPLAPLKLCWLDKLPLTLTWLEEPQKLF